jgi:phosphoribosylformimino-5-aminoimidazole carboxamide ribonucleotide (ProFAR) isomerase
MLAAAGAPRLLVRDRDADGDTRASAAANTILNAGALTEIVRATTLDVAMAGGVRTLGDCERVLALGARWAVLDPEALATPDEVERACGRLPRRILVTVVARVGKVRETPSGAGAPLPEPLDALEIGAALARAGAAGVIYTDLAPDGGRAPANLEATARLARKLTPCPVLDGGAVTRLEELDDVARTGAFAAVVGPSLYETQASLEAAIARAQAPQP